MKKRFAIIVIISVVGLGASCGYVFYILFNSTDKKLILNCITVGIIYGLINAFVTLFFINKYSIANTKSKKLEQAIRLDKLTGLFSRYALDDDIKNNKYSEDISMIYLDIDYFSNFNNTYGHDAGDIILKNVAKIIKKSIRPIDVAYRFGGDELLIILNNCTKENAIEIGENIIKNIRDFDNKPYIEMTISAGLASIPDDVQIGVG